MNLEARLRRRIKALTWIFIIGLIMSGATAIPIRWEVDKLVEFLAPNTMGVQPLESLDPFTRMLCQIQDSFYAPAGKNRFLFYGTDWLAFGHFVIAFAFVGALRDPVRNRWLFDFGLIACVLVIPYAMIFGEVRGIPFFWRLIDCSFGIIGFVPMWFCRKCVCELEQRT